MTSVSFFFLMLVIIYYFGLSRCCVENFGDARIKKVFSELVLSVVDERIQIPLN